MSRIVQFIGNGMRKIDLDKWPDVKDEIGCITNKKDSWGWVIREIMLGRRRYGGAVQYGDGFCTQRLLRRIKRFVNSKTCRCYKPAH